MVREAWTDERLDDLKEQMTDSFARVETEMREGFARVDREMKEGFARVDREMKEGFARVDREMKEGFARVDREMKEGFARVGGEFVRVDGDIRELRRMMFHGFIALIAIMVTGFLSLAGLIVF